MSLDRLRHESPTTSRTNRRRFLAGASAALAGSTLSATALAQEATPSPEGTPTRSVDFNQAQFDVTFTHHTTMVNDVRLHYVIGGQGDAVVLLHGWPQTWYEWRAVMPALAERYTVIVPDMRGLGDSGKPAMGYDARTVAADIHALVEQLGHRRIFLVGHDLGGWVAYA